MDTLEHVESLLKRREHLEESMRYAAPEEILAIEKAVCRVMRRVVLLLGLVVWVDK